MHVADENSALQTDKIQIFCLFACLFIFFFLTINSSATKQNRKMERQLPCPAAQSKRMENLNGKKMKRAFFL